MNAPPIISVIIPALNEDNHIAACLRSLNHQTYPQDRLELIVVDNGSSDTTCDRVREAGARLLHEPRKSAYWARNLGIQESRGQWLAFTDADCIADPNWLSQLLDQAEHSDADVVGGLIRYELAKDTLGNRLLIENHCPEKLRATVERFKSVAGGNMFVRRETFDRHGLFNVIAWGSDIEFSKRVAKNGGTVTFAAEAIVTHQCDLTNWEYYRRSFETRYGQVLLFDPRRGLGAAVRNLIQVPWKPGLRAGRDRYREQTIPPAPLVKDWIYRWGNRWMEFIGEQTALMKKTGGPQHG